MCECVGEGGREIEREIETHTIYETILLIFPFFIFFLFSSPVGFSPPLTLSDLEACGPLSDTVRDRSTEILALIRDVLQVMPTAVEVRECVCAREREREREI